ncbi:3-keto-disaccharide hydrolase [Humisphaera borealis]|uniref:DUF1080 domain-containing protein n=1 Tax=Humisphaera borealis TaxID=2807512 RepID=A0A7M2WWD0_9BACT|nr:DUF1080 domain-containing protein [Humisphaera borealis]QOV89847.1 DUF1080 domain-containing protein [Humisphaera borealis]
MTFRRALFSMSLAAAMTGGVMYTFAAEPPKKAEAKKAEPAKKADAEKKPAAGVWTDAADATLPADFALQGEYVSQGGDATGAQVIALNAGEFQVVVLPGGLPGAGWDGKSKSLLVGKIEGGKVALKAAEGARKYLAAKPEEFSATSKFPPEGHKAYTGVLEAGTLSLTADGGKTIELKKTLRTSPTLEAKPPAGAVVLFDGSNKDKWKGGRVDEKTKLLNTDGADIVTTDKFLNYTAHVEFMLPFKPEGRGQGRGNSGFYQVDHYEVQILDSFGLDGKNNECGGVYTKAEPSVNACLPPLTWQTYDVEFTAAKTDATGKKIANARLTARLNGVLIHDNIEINGPTGGARKDPEGTPGPIKLQGHGNPLQFRNVWIVEKK